MASATGIPDHPPPPEDAIVSSVDDTEALDETEPLLGRPGDVSQGEGQSYLYNLIQGTGVLAQFGIWLLLILIWASVLTKDLILFSGHPLAQSVGILLLVQSALVLQPTHTVDQKRVGQRIHAGLNLAALVALTTGVVVIEYNKFANNGLHFHSVHGYLGVATSAVLAAQYTLGFTMWAAPSLYGGIDRARSLYRYHRWAGYLVLVLLLATVAAAVDTPYNENVLKLRLWAVLLLSALVLVGVIPRVRKHKLGFTGKKPTVI
ncbi:Eukaryotic cytochrome b561 [Geosmithia morbida]|uniref:Eukaryotic cytochrome b561 n=1 Tax=Geosmithia morbida TaxID=1094350 RepID=A0A9P5D6P5_9HYPO|nr:Eukaryotic cytochrome b561 [Geosmithia morbida]KAF4125806.1 Eukaryotic cytochrome b561 [Geosmithia morbida]